MTAETAEALVLRTYRFGEADRIVVFLTEDRGKKRGVARHATNSRRRFGGALEPLTRGRATYVEREGRDLVRLDRIEATSSPLGGAGRTDAASGAHALGHAAYFAELIDEWAPENAANPRLFRLGASVAEALAAGGAAEALGRYFEYWLLRLEGVYPPVGMCPRCGRESLSAGAVLVAAERALVCRTCAPAGPGLSAGAMAFLAAAGRQTPREAGEGGAAPGVLRELEHVHHRLIALHLDKELRSARVVRELRPGL
jgi:DNA repair protein RecO (recombination protein O)